MCDIVKGANVWKDEVLVCADK